MVIHTTDDVPHTTIIFNDLDKHIIYARLCRVQVAKYYKQCRYWLKRTLLCHPLLPQFVRTHIVNYVGANGIHLNQFHHSKTFLLGVN